MLSFVILLFALLFFFSRKKGLSLFLLIVLSTGGFWFIGLVTTIGGFSIKLTDLGLIYILLIIVYKLFKGELQKLNGPFKVLNYFLIFLTISILIDLSINGTPLEDIFRTSRNWLFILFVYIVPSYTKEDILYAIKLVVIVTTIQLLLFLSEPITGIVLFSPYGMIEALKMTNVTRYSLFPPLLFFLFVWIYTNQDIKKIYKNLLIGLIFLAIVITLIRSLVLALAFIVVISIFLTKNQSLSKKLMLIIFIFVSALSISMYEPISSRFSESTKDVTSLGGSSKKVEGNMSFRILLASERLEYILEDTQKTIFGIGFIQEKNFKGHFRIGLKDEKNRTIQLDTGDIAWPTLFLRFGLVGTFLYMLFYILLIIYFWKNKEDSIGMAGLYFMIIYLIWSITGASITEGTFVIIPSLLYYLIEYKNKEKLLGIKL